MATKRRNLFLYLALACFVGIIAIFIVDGYMGIYDTVYIVAGEREQTIKADFWLRRYRASPPAYHISVEWEEKVFFCYEVDNRQFSTYSTPIQASVWKENEKLLDLFSEDESIKPFDKVRVEWTLDSEQLQSRGFSQGEYTVKIERKRVERKIRIGYHYPPTRPVYPQKVPPPPPR